MYAFIQKKCYDMIINDEMEIFRQIVPSHHYLINPENESITCDSYGNILYDITYEPKMSLISVRKENIFYPLIEGRSNILSTSIIEAYKGIPNVDEKIKNIGYFENGIYMGSIFIFYDVEKMFVAIYGIRLSLVNMILGFKGFAKKMIEYVEELGFKKVLIPQPLEPMRRLAEDMNYNEYIAKRRDDEVRFLNKISKVGTYFMKNIE